MAAKKETLFYSSSLQRFKGIRKFKKEHRNVKVLEKGVDIVEHGYKGKCTCSYWVTIQYED